MPCCSMQSTAARSSTLSRLRYVTRLRQSTLGAFLIPQPSLSEWGPLFDIKIYITLMQRMNLLSKLQI